MENYSRWEDANKPNLPIPLGGELLAEISTMNLRLKVSLVGMEKGQFLLAKALPNGLAGTFRSENLKESRIKLSFLHGGTVYGFSSEIINMVTQPAKMFFMAYPDKIEEVNVRHSTRIDCTLSAVTMIGHEIVTLILVDISEEGCQAVIKVEGSNSPLFGLVQMDKRIDLKVQFPGAPHRHPITGIIRNTGMDSDKIFLGISFMGLRPEVRDELEKYISQISKNKKH
ncbi:MAG: PilZ domain-containing protein [Deltaproteobacteria bacterium]|nr:PilZ domain-containing protein [Deltaproteobacteria bacterium]